MNLTKAQRGALEALAKENREAMGVSVYDWGPGTFSTRRVAWIHPATLASLQRLGLIAESSENSMRRHITDSGRAALSQYTAKRDEEGGDA